MNLQDQQSGLLAALFKPWEAVQSDSDLARQQTWSEHQYQRGLQAYRTNASVIAQSVLVATYPTLARLMGSEQFDGLAIHFWRKSPPVRGDLAQWGAGLDDFLRAIPELMAHEPYLADVASLEWALHVGKTAADSASNDPAPLAIVDSEYAIVDLVDGKEWVDVSDKEGQRALVYRHGFQTLCISISKDIAL